ncbi:MAG: prephenate dehydrogenase/arogenate dehydrogenase family protein [Rickettsiales bacterium]|jgi:ribosomal protein S15P/S13E|nr:prephenate dehydrogenase/arogenate dehydrogenase family protein [Rickettsiales bacterium]
MYKILFIGLDDLTKEIIKRMPRDNFIFGFDIESKKMDEFYSEKIIANYNKDSIQKVFESVDIVILNTKEYNKIADHLRYTKKDVIIIDTNSIKNNIEKVREIFKKNVNFISTNFLLFPDLVILNIDKKINFQTIRETNAFIKMLNVKTLPLSYVENDFLITIYQLFFLMQIIFLKNFRTKFFKINNFILDLIFKDILLNKKNLLKKIEKVLFFLKSLDEENFFVLLRENVLNLSYNNLDIDLDDENADKIFLEKTFMHLLKDEDLDNFNILNINFTYKLYNNIRTFEYFEKNNRDFLLLMVNEKLKSLYNILNFVDLTDNKLKIYLNIL